MTTFFFLGILVFAFWGALQLPVPSRIVVKKDSRASSARPELRDLYARLPLSFEANHGQRDDSIKFLARGPGYGVFLKSTEAVLVLSKQPAKKLENPKSTVLRMQLVGANAHSQT